MDDDTSATNRLRLDADGRIDEDLLCLKCEYNLRGLDPEGSCPECGTVAGETPYGSILRLCDSAWVDGLASGMRRIERGKTTWARPTRIAGVTMYGSDGSSDADSSELTGENDQGVHEP